MKHLVIGLGEVGMAVREVFESDGYDPIKFPLPTAYPQGAPYDVLHICFPYQEAFEAAVQKYIDEFLPKYTVVHSTVPIGTCEKLGVNHSPVRGKHPNLAQSIKTFTKYIGGPDALLLADEFRLFGIPATPCRRARDMEALKLWDTTQYGAMIMLEKEIHQFCQDNNLDFDLIYRHANLTYNDGYEEMGLPGVRRPILKHIDGKIGGHCVVPNAKLLNSPTAKKIYEQNT